MEFHYRIMKHVLVREISGNEARMHATNGPLVAQYYGCELPKKQSLQRKLFKERNKNNTHKIHTIHQKKDKQGIKIGQSYKHASGLDSLQ